ncbi:MAG TPA: hypothetical protein VLL31_05550 [Sulfurovum sp.]|nr:hypothetical protein [Sulfurovum sp.]
MKKTLLTLGAAALFTTPSLFAGQNSLQEHFQMEQKLQNQYQKRVKNGSGSTYRNQYQYKNEYQYNYQGSNSNRSGIGSAFGRGGRH